MYRRRVWTSLTLLVTLGACVEAAPSDLATETARAALGANANPASPPPAAQGAFTAFETGQVRPLALSPSGRFLFAVNTPDNRVEVFRVHGNDLTLVSSVPVGLEPLAVAARSDTEIWVVNHLSDSVSIVRIDPNGESGRVVRTLLVGDEPRDIVFAGRDRERAFITTAHRGQNNPNDPQLTTPGVGRADVWVFDARTVIAGDGSLGGAPLTILTLFTDTPRALAATPDGSRVYAAGFHSGNQTTSVAEFLIPDGGDAAGGVPGPRVNHQLAPAPEVGIIVKFDGQHWRDVKGKVWDDVVRFHLPDKDVFAIDATANPPRPIEGSNGWFAGVGTILFNMVVNPANGKVYVSNLESRNDLRFEGPGEFTSGETLRGHLSESRISVLAPSANAGRVTPRYLNKHIDYSHCCDPIPNPENAKSLAFPLDMAITRDGATLYVAALGSSKVGVYATRALENDTFVPDTSRQIQVTGGGPTGLALDDRKDRLYVMTRFDNGISVVDTRARTEIAHVRLHNPEPASVREGRRFLYDASRTSSHGDQACASCHIFGDFDSLAWDLGNPDEDVKDNPGPFLDDPFTAGFPFKSFHPLKGPMMTQSLRGMANGGPMHWRGDRTGGRDAPSVQPDQGSFDEVAAFEKFNPAFQSLLGNSAQLSAADMRRFADFALRITYPPNPIRRLDNSLTPDQAAGRAFFHEQISDPQGQPCVGCHKLDPSANPTSLAPGFFGTSGIQNFEFETQVFKVPHLRNMYQKVGRFGFPEHFLVPPVDNQFMGDQVRGFGFLHDGSFDTVNRFISLIAFIFPPEPQATIIRRQVEQFVLAFDSNLAPIVGQQATLTLSNRAAAQARMDLLRERAEVGECDLVAKRGGGEDEEGFFYVRSEHRFVRDRRRAPPISDSDLRSASLALGRPLTYTCVPLGSGQRIGVDRDGDGVFDGDEVTR